MKNSWVVLVLILLGLSTPSLYATKTMETEQRLEGQLTLGVYWPWERTKFHAQTADKEFWSFVDDTMSMLKNELHCNLIWFTNGPDDPGRVCELAEKHGLKILITTKLAGYFHHGMPSEKKLQQSIQDIVTPMLNQKALAGYVLKDEAKSYERAQMEVYSQALKSADPSRPSILVSMPKDTQAYALGTDLPIICSDIYHFGGDRSPNIPNPNRRSQSSYRRTINALTQMTRKSKKIAWAMPQAFAEFRGPFWLNDKQNAMLEPGTYWHWRMPSKAQIKWQTWESIRAGCQGVVFFTLFFNNKYATWNPADGKAPEKLIKQMKVAQKNNWPSVKKQINTHAPLCLTYSNGRPTKQALAMALEFKFLNKIKNLISNWKPAPVPVSFTSDTGATKSFRVLGDPSIYVVVVNDDCEQSNQLSLRFLPHTTQVINLKTGNPLILSDELIGHEALRKAVLPLDAGAGTVLRVHFANNESGQLLVDESFDLRHLVVKLENAQIVSEPRSFGMGTQSRVRAEPNSSGSASIILEKLDKKPQRGSLLAGKHRGLRQNKNRIYLLIDGKYPNSESIVVQCIGQDNAKGWNKTDHYELPFSIPAGTKSIRIQLAQDAAIDRIRIWSCPPDRNIQTSSLTPTN